MLTVQHTEHFRLEAPGILTIGTFDGVHLGHQKILQRLAELKEKTGLRTVVLTFDPHPRKVLFPEQKDLKLLTLVDEKLELLEKHGVDITVVYPFSKQFSALSSEKYIQEILIKSLNVKQLVIGYDHKFGRDRGGDIRTLRSYAPHYDFNVEEISAQDIENISVSSSKIRKALEEGNLEQASRFLGHRYSLSGKVVRGKQLGRELGYPTANLQVHPDKLIPGKGIYFAEAEFDDKTYPGMMSIGENPTTDHDNKIKVEIHLFDFSGDLYDKKLKLNIISRLRDEKKFANLTELKEALDRDKEECLQLLMASR
jgi:riboflavin kinase / FMN adenylyltransferase